MMSRFIGILFTGLLGLVLLTTAGQSGDKEKKSTKLKGMLPPGWKQLKLSPEQVQKVYEIQNMYKEKVAALEEQILSVKGQEKAEMFKLLTEEQKSLARKLFTGEDTRKKETAPKKNPSDSK